MRPYTEFVRLRASLGLGAALALTAVLQACTLTVDVKGLPGNSGGGGSGNGSGSGSGSGSGGGSGGGSSSGAGAGGGVVSMYGLGVTELVSAGGLTKSSNYKLVFTLGQPSIQQDNATSLGYRMQGGLEGANGSLP